MLSIRFSRVGKKKAPVYRIVVMPKQSDPWANSTEILGHYNPRKTPKEVVINAERAKYWLSQGAQASDTVWNLFVEQKIVEGEKRSTSHISKKHATKIVTKTTEAKAKEDDKAEKAKAAKEAEVTAAKEKAEAETVATAEASAEPETSPKTETVEEAPPSEQVSAEPEAPTEIPAVENTEATPDTTPTA